MALLNLGATLASQGRFDEALGPLHAALQIAPGRYQTHNDIGNILEKTGRPAEATEEYREAIGLDPRIPYLHNSLGVALTQLGEAEQAQKEFLEAEKLDPQYGWPHIEMAKLFLGQNRDLEAVAELHIAVQLEPDNDEILAYVAHVLAACPNAMVRDGPTALKYALKANARGGDKVVILDALGMALAENGDYTNAVTCAQNAFNIALASGMNNTNAIRVRLELYQKNQPWRESFKLVPAPVQPPLAPPATHS
jgi:Flp pilus assembly protein TadD